MLGALGNLLHCHRSRGRSPQKSDRGGFESLSELNNQDLSATILDNFGNLLTAQKYPEAIAAYNESAALARSPAITVYWPEKR